MTAQMAVKLALLGSLWLVVFSLGARSLPEDALYLMRRPALLIRALLAIFIAAPLVAILLSSAFSLAPGVKFALIALSVAPVPPLVATKQAKVGARGDYAIGLLASIALVSLIATPVLVAVASRLMGVEATVIVADVAKTLIITIAIPLGAGMALRQFAPKAAAATQHLAYLIGMVILVCAFGIVVAKSWPQIRDLIGNGSILAFSAMVIVSLAIGHFLGSAPEDERGALALATTTRHPGVALAIASASFPDQQQEAAAGILLFLLVSAVITGVYVRFMTRRSGDSGPLHTPK